METKKILAQIGLSESESKVYIACLTLGTSSITDIAKEANLKRPTVYLIIDELLNKKLLIKTPMGRRIKYRAEDPAKIISDLDTKKEALESALPSLRKLYKSSDKKPKVSFFEGKDQLVKLYENIMRGPEILAAFSIEKFLNVFSRKEQHRFFDILRKNNGHIYDMLIKSKTARKLAKEPYREDLVTQKFLPSNFKFATDILVARDKVALVSLESSIGIIIENKEIAATQRQFLQFIWNHI